MDFKASVQNFHIKKAEGNAIDLAIVNVISHLSTQKL